MEQRRGENGGRKEKEEGGGERCWVTEGERGETQVRMKRGPAPCRKPLLPYLPRTSAADVDPLAASTVLPF